MFRHVVRSFSLQQIQMKQSLQDSVQKPALSMQQTLKFKIPANGLLDFSVCSISTPVHIKMIGGKDAEIHGYPLTKHKTYTVHDGGIGIYSWRGSKVEVSGYFTETTIPRLLVDDEASSSSSELTKEPKSSELQKRVSSPIQQYLMVHSRLRTVRSQMADTELIADSKLSDDAEDEDIEGAFHSNLECMGPRVLILGAVDTGKSTLCKSLINWAQRLDDEPLFVDLDCGQNAMSVPGTLCGDIVTDYHIPWSDYQHQNTMRSPFVFYYGNTSPSHCESLYKHFVSVAALRVKRKMLNSPKQRSAGCIINTCGFTEGPLALSIIKRIMTSFAVNYIIVLQHPQQHKLLTFLRSVNQSIPYDVHLCDLPPISSVKRRDQNERFLKRQAMCSRYFYGHKILNPLLSSTESDDSGQFIPQFVDEYTPFERNYQFKELAIYEIIRHFEAIGSYYSCSSSSDNGNEGKKKKGKRLGKGQSAKAVEVSYPYVDGSSASKFQIKSKRFDENMIGNLIAVTHAQNADELLTANVAGFLYMLRPLFSCSIRE